MNYSKVKDLKLPLNTMQVLKERYLLRDSDRKVIETPSLLFKRVASNISKAELNFKSKYKRKQIEDTFYNMMINLEFMPNSPTLMNAGTFLGQLSACFVLPVADSMDGIFESLKNMAQIHQAGGGTGFSFSQLRPKNDLVNSTKGSASGPVSFMSIYNSATGVIIQGGRRRGANMGILRCDHPDILEFIEAKTKKGAFSNFNLSVGITDKFMDSVLKNKTIDLINPRTNKKVKSVRAKEIFNRIVKSAWHSGDPGMVFLDEINRHNPTPKVGVISATNPCGELPLLPYESCNLGSINLSKMVVESMIDWQKLEKCIYLGIRFLDNVIEVNKFPLPQIKEITRANRKIGLGIMGFADMLIKLGISYNSEEAVQIAAKIMKFFRQKSIQASIQLARERGVFPNFKKSVYAKKNLKLRNATVNTIAPTGTISIIAGCSSGIEPLFGVSFMRNVLSGSKLFEINPLFEEKARGKRIYNKKLISKIAKSGSIQKIKGIPKDLKRLFITAFEIPPSQHLNIQAAFQEYTDNSVSKTINLPANASVKDIYNIYLTAYKLKCKGITIYRYGSKKEQVLTFGKIPAEFVIADPFYSGGCITGPCVF